MSKSGGGNDTKTSSRKQSKGGKPVNCCFACLCWTTCIVTAGVGHRAYLFPGCPNGLRLFTCNYCFWGWLKDFCQLSELTKLANSERRSKRTESTNMSRD